MSARARSHAAAACAQSFRAEALRASERCALAHLPRERSQACSYLELSPVTSPREHSRAGRSSEEADVLLVAASTRASSVARACSAWPKSLWQSADASHASTRS